MTHNDRKSFGLHTFFHRAYTFGERLRARGKPTREILEFAVAMQANSLDRYIKMERAVGDERSRELFRSLAREEQAHLVRMTSLLDRLHGLG